MIVDTVMDGWWVAEPGLETRQLKKGDSYDPVIARGPFPTREQAENARWRDLLPSYFYADLTVHANHCLGCGRWAKTVAFDHSHRFPWYATDCKKCGVTDTRNSPWDQLCRT